MAEMATTPVFACRVCGKPVLVTHLSSLNDANAEKLKMFMQGLSKIALCDYHRQVYNWYASQNRSDEFLLNPNIVIYNVVDKSNLDYYGKKG